MLLTTSPSWSFADGASRSFLNRRKAPSVADWSAPMSFEYPTTSAETIAARRRWVGLFMRRSLVGAAWPVHHPRTRSSGRIWTSAPGMPRSSGGEFGESSGTVTKPLPALSAPSPRRAGLALIRYLSPDCPNFSLQFSVKRGDGTLGCARSVPLLGNYPQTPLLEGKAFHGGYGYAGGR